MKSAGAMKILFLADSALPHAGGSRVYYHNLYKRLARLHGDRVTVVTKKVPRWREFDAVEAGGGFTVIRHFRPAGNWKYYQLHKLLLPLLHIAFLTAKIRPDLIHVGDLYPQGAIAWLLKTVFGVPYVAYCHGEEVTQIDQCRSERILRDAVYRRADAVIAASNFARQNLLRIGVAEEKIVKINPGVDMKQFAPGPAPAGLVQRFSLEGKFVILTVARLVRRKGHENMLKAVAQIAGACPDLRYLIVGTGPEEDNLRRLANQLGIADLVHFAGYVPSADLPDCYRACDVLAMPNFEESGTGDVEGFGMVFLEANAVGKPVIAGRSGGTAEAVLDGVTGYLCDPHDVDALATLLRTLAADRELCRRLGAQGLARVREEFHWDSRAARLHAFSAELLERRRTTTPRPEQTVSVSRPDRAASVK